MSNNKHLTLKEQGFVTDIIKNKNGTEAVINNYKVKSRANARSMAIELRKKPRIQEAIRLEMTKQGLTPEVVIDALKQNLIKGIGVKATAETTNRAIDLYARITGLYNSEDIEQSYKLTLSKLSNKELRIELEKLQRYSTALISEL